MSLPATVGLLPEHFLGWGFILLFIVVCWPRTRCFGLHAPFTCSAHGSAFELSWIDGVYTAVYLPAGTKDNHARLNREGAAHL